MAFSTLNIKKVSLNGFKKEFFMKIERITFLNRMLKLGTQILKNEKSLDISFVNFFACVKCEKTYKFTDNKGVFPKV